VGPGLLAHDPQGGPGRSGSVQDVINGGLLTGRTEILGKDDAGSGEELTSPGDAGPG
jgi:hypothetical protein